ncbi:hypothetical protein JCM31447_21460 [Fluviispira sanaruensis]|uniref:Uncharacterized protein n=1 Tax=Fluviispira sanaruensis TaxID=2493639 RepID=A0A4P2VPI5_FLUSA|nr:hypothetical protein JCM31447_21460 [Fluviispira sanaruensis]
MVTRDAKPKNEIKNLLSPISEKIFLSEFLKSNHNKLKITPTKDIAKEFGTIAKITRSETMTTPIRENFSLFKKARNSIFI